MMTGGELRAIRLRLGLRQVEFAAALGRGQASVSDCERGRRQVMPDLEARARELELGQGAATSPTTTGSMICPDCLCWRPPGSDLCGCSHDEQIPADHSPR